MDETALAEKNLKHTWKFTPKKDRADPHPVDYFVPSFGADPEMAEAVENEELARIQVWHERLTGDSDVGNAYKKMQE